MKQLSAEKLLRALCADGQRDVVIVQSAGFNISGFDVTIIGALAREIRSCSPRWAQFLAVKFSSAWPLTLCGVQIHQCLHDNGHQTLEVIGHNRSYQFTGCVNG